MDTTEALLMFLYDNKKSLRQVEINHIFKDCGLALGNIRVIIRDLELDNIIQVTPTYKKLEGFERGQQFTLDNTTILAKLTLVGIKFVEDNYLPKPEPTPTIKADNVVYNTGTISGQISQASNQSHADTSDSHNKHIQNKTTAKSPPTFWKSIIIFIGVAASIATIYEVFLKDKF